VLSGLDAIATAAIAVTTGGRTTVAMTTVAVTTVIVAMTMTDETGIGATTTTASVTETAVVEVAAGAEIVDEKAEAKVEIEDIAAKVTTDHLRRLSRACHCHYCCYVE